MSRVVLIEAFPRRPSDGATVAFRVAGGDLDRANHFGHQWQPVVGVLPRMATQLGFDGHVFGDGAVATVGELILAWSEAIDPFLGYLWANASVTIKVGARGDADGAFTTLWSGRAATARYSSSRVVLTLADPAEELRRPLLTDRFAGTGDLEGDADLEGTLKPRAWGECESVPCLLIDSAYNIWMAADDAVTFGAVRDGGVPYTTGPSVADLAALRAASIADGAVATCPSLGLVRPWTAPKLKLTADVTVGSTTAADIAEAMVTDRTTLTFATGTVAAFNAIQGNAIGTWVNDEHSIAEELDRIFAGLGSWWKLNASQEIELGQFEFGASAQSFEAEVADITRQEILIPSYRRLVGYRRNFSPLSDGEIAAAITSGDVEGLGLLATKDQAAWDGDLSGRPDDAQILNNLVSMEGWEIGASMPTAWHGEYPNGDPLNQTTFELTEGPYADLVVAIKSLPDASGLGLGGFQQHPTQNPKVNKNKPYRLSVWVKTVNVVDGNRLYFGPQSGSGLLGSMGAGDNALAPDNPYFMSGSNTPEYFGMEANKWYLLVGYIWPASHSGHTDFGGVYDPDTGQKLAPLTSYKWLSTVTAADELGARAFQYTDGSVDTADYAWWWAPRFEVIDDNAPTIAGLLQGVDFNYVSGVTRPEDNATVDTRYPTQNMLGSDAGPEQTLSVAYDYSGFAAGTTGMPIATLGLEVGDVISGGIYVKRNSGTGSPLLLIGFYDSGGGLISQHLSPGTTSASYVRQKIENLTIPASTVYVRFRATYSGGTTNMSFKQAMFNAGTRSLPFEQPPTRVGRGEVEEGATQNIITAGTATPTGGTDGDLYYETDARAWWSKIGGVWTKVSDETASNIAAGIANQGNLATLDEVDTPQIVDYATEEGLFASTTTIKTLSFINGTWQEYTGLELANVATSGDAAAEVIIDVNLQGFGYVSTDTAFALDLRVTRNGVGQGDVSDSFFQKGQMDVKNDPTPQGFNGSVSVSFASPGGVADYSVEVRLVPNDGDSQFNNGGGSNYVRLTSGQIKMREILK